MRRTHKPGPKSRTLRQSDCDEAENTPPHRNVTFQSPTTDSDDTNYGLEFTSRGRSRQSLRDMMSASRQQTATDYQSPSTSRQAARSQRKDPHPRRRKTKNQLTKMFEAEVKRLQNSKTFLIPRMPFSRLVRELMLQHHPELRITSTALEALQETTELYITQRLEDAYLLTLHRSRVTLMPKDIELINYLRRFD